MCLFFSPKDQSFGSVFFPFLKGTEVAINPVRLLKQLQLLIFLCWTDTKSDFWHNQDGALDETPSSQSNDYQGACMRARMAKWSVIYEIWKMTSHPHVIFKYP